MGQVVRLWTYLNANPNVLEVAYPHGQQGDVRHKVEHASTHTCQH